MASWEIPELQRALSMGKCSTHGGVNFPLPRFFFVKPTFSYWANPILLDSIANFDTNWPKYQKIPMLQDGGFLNYGYPQIIHL